MPLTAYSPREHPPSTDSSPDKKTDADGSATTRVTSSGSAEPGAGSMDSAVPAVAPAEYWETTSTSAPSAPSAWMISELSWPSTTGTLASVEMRSSTSSGSAVPNTGVSVSYTHLRAHETRH